MHINIQGETVSTGKYSHGYAIPLFVECEYLDMEIPTQITLEQNYPNPFNPATTIDFSLVEPGPVNLTVYDMAGNRIATLVDGQLSAGQHSVGFNAGNLASGIYCYTLKTGGQQLTRKMVLIK